MVKVALTWYLTRSTGIVAWAALTIAVLLGLAVSGRALGRRPTLAWLNDLHRGAATTSVVFTALHLAALVADSYVEFGLREILVPMASEWRPLAVTYGVVALYLLALVHGTSLVRDRLPRRVWRTIHWASFPLQATATLHFVEAGADADEPVFAALIALSVIAIGAFAVVRAASADRRRRAGAPARDPTTGPDGVADSDGATEPGTEPAAPAPSR